MELKDIKFDAKNYRKHSDSNKALIKKSIKETGLGRSVVIDSENELIAGNGVVSQLPEGTPIKVVETDGSTLIACEQLHRKCRMMELDAHYCDVILTRWENLTGKQAQRIE